MTPEKLLDLTHLRPHIQAALRHAGDTHSVADVEAMIAAGHLQAWPGPASLVLTEIVVFPQAKHLHVYVAVGNRTELAAMQPLIAEWGKSQGCSKASLTGRTGWRRMPFLRDSGWRETHIRMERDL